jgi:hypothetical protein
MVGKDDLRLLCGTKCFLKLTHSVYPGHMDGRFLCQPALETNKSQSIRASLPVKECSMRIRRRAESEVEDLRVLGYMA